MSQKSFRKYRTSIKTIKKKSFKEMPFSNFYFWNILHSNVYLDKKMMFRSSSVSDADPEVLQKKYGGERTLL